MMIRSVTLFAASAAFAPALAAQDPAAAAAAPATAPEEAQDPQFEAWHPYRPAGEADYKVARWGPRHLPSPGYAFRAAKVVPVTSAPILDGVVVTRNGTIEAVGPAETTPIPAGYELVDCGDAMIFPGLVELHSHIASESFDLNDTVHQTNPEFRTVDLITMDHEQLRTARAGGISVALYIPGSGSNMGGFGTLTKTWGRSPDEALVRFPGCLKIAQAGNPERGGGDLGSGMMGMSDGIRQTLLRGRDYLDQVKAAERGEGPMPKYDPTLEMISGLFRHEYPVAVHTQIYQVVHETLRELRRELGLWTIIAHGTFDGFRLSEDMLDAGVPVANGPRQYHFDSHTGRMEGLAANWALGSRHGWRKAVRGLGRDGVTINTDAPVVAQEQLTLQAAMAVRLGLPHEWALRGMTINAARMIGVDHRLGSLDVGKDADLGVWSGDPVDPRSYVELMVVNGTICYRRDPQRPVF